VKLNNYARQFIEDGYTKLDLSRELAEWVETTRQAAQRSLNQSTPKAGRHNDGEFDTSTPLPRVPLLEETLNEVLATPAYPERLCQLSTMLEGFGGEDPGRHVDGADEAAKWAGLLVGILLVDVPPSDAGNLLVWPRTHRATQERFNALAAPISRNDISREIRKHGSGGEHVTIGGPAGTVVILDHRVEHGIGRHRTPGLCRQVVYFRLPGFTSVPEEVVNAHHFLRHG
jgi:hypothetical protein